MKYRLLVTKAFGTKLAEDGRTVLGKRVTVPRGVLVEYLTIGAWDKALVKYTQPNKQPLYVWVHSDEIEQEVG